MPLFGPYPSIEKLLPAPVWPYANSAALYLRRQSRCLSGHECACVCVCVRANQHEYVCKSTVVKQRCACCLQFKQKLSSRV